MRLRLHFFLLSLAPLLVSLGLITVGVKYQEKRLSDRERTLFESAYMSARKTELQQYIQLARGTIAPLYFGSQNNDAIRREALRLLSTLDFGVDGYFFVYETNGTNIMHARQPELVGKNLLEMRDTNGVPVIRELITKALDGGGFVRYAWEKPSSKTIAPKLGYAELLPEWGWVIGSGLYLDDIQTTLDQVDQQISDNVATTLWWIATVALLGVVLIGTTGFALNWSEARDADEKLRLMARRVVQSQEDERAHLSRELHDSTSQTLVSIKLLIESAIANMDADNVPAPPALPQALERLKGALCEVRLISHRLRPVTLDLLGLTTALENLGREFNVTNRFHFIMRARGSLQNLPSEVNTVLFRITQEALTNIEKHARSAQRVQLRLIFHSLGVRLSVIDNGAGFDVASISKDPHRGIGLRNMRERLASIHGTLKVFSSSTGTRLVADVPLPALSRLSQTSITAVQ